MVRICALGIKQYHFLQTSYSKKIWKLIIKCDNLFYKVRQKFIIITKRVNLLLHSATIFYAKCDNCYYKVRQLVLQSAMTFKRWDRTQRSTLQSHILFAIEAVRVEKGSTCNLSPLLFTLPIANNNPQVPSSIVCICDERRAHSNISNDLAVNWCSFHHLCYLESL